MSDDAVLVLEIGNERAHFEAAFPQLEVVWLATSARRRPGAAASPREALAEALQAGDPMITLEERHPAPRRQGRARRRQRHHQPRREGRAGRPQRRRQVDLFALLPAAARRRRRCRMPPRWRIGEVAQTCPRPTRPPPISCSTATRRWSTRRPPLAARRSRPTTATRWPTRTIALDDAGGFDARAARAGADPRPGLSATNSTRRSTASPAAGACACNWRAR